MSHCLTPRACLHLQTSKRVLLAPRTAAEAWSQGASHPGRQHLARQGRVAKEGHERVERGKSIFNYVPSSPTALLQCLIWFHGEVIALSASTTLGP